MTRTPARALGAAGAAGLLTLLAGCTLWDAPAPPGAAALARLGAPEVDLARPPAYAGELRAQDTLGPIATAADDERARGLAIAPERPAPVEGEGPLRLSVEDAVLLALANNRSLSVEQLSPVIVSTFEDLERAVYDPEVFAQAQVTLEESQDVEAGALVTEERAGSGVLVGVRQLLPTGTEVELGLSQDRLDLEDGPERNAARAGLTLTQALLRGGDLDANLASIRQAEIDNLVSVYELRAFAELLLATVEITYWDHVLARRQIEIVEQSLAVARQQQQEAERRIAVGQLAETELAAVRAEVALREQSLIDARSALERTRLELLRLLNPVSAEGWDRPVEAVEEPAVPDLPLDRVEDHVALALLLRPDLNQARLDVQRGRLEVVQTRNGLLPILDVFVTLGKSGFADSFASSFTSLDEPGYDLAAGLRASYPIGNRGPRSLHRRALATRDQAARSVANFAQLVSLDVRTAFLEVRRSREQIQASAVTRAAQEEVLRAENAKFRAGNVTSFTVAQAQRDLLEAQIAEVQAAVAYRQALIELYRLEGTLLKRRAIDAPGARPVQLGLPVAS